MPEIKGDYQGRLKTIKCTTDAKLETVATVDSIGTINRLNSQGTVTNIPQVWDVDWLNYYNFEVESLGLRTSPGINSGTFMPLAVNAGGKLILDTLGTVKRVKNIDNLGTVGRLQTVGMIEGGTISEVVHVGTVGDITHLGSLGNVSRIDDLGSVDSQMHAKTFVGGVWTNLYQQDNGLITSPGKCAAGHYPLSVNAAGELKTAPATTRKGGNQVVNNKGTAVALIGTHTECISVIVKAQHENLGTIYLGDSGVTPGSAFLLRRDEFISFSADDVNDVYIDASRGTQSVSFLYINY